MPEPTLRWSGAAELRADGAVRVGSLYLLEEVLYFVDGGRTDKRVKPHAALFALAAALATAPASIEVYAFLWVQGGKGTEGTLAQVATAIVSALLFLAAVVSRNKMKSADDAAMDTLASMEEVPPVAFLDDWCVEDGGSFRLPLVDIESCVAQEDRDLRIVTRLLDRYDLTVRPSRDRLLACLRP